MRLHWHKFCSETALFKAVMYILVNLRIFYYISIRNIIAHKAVIDDSPQKKGGGGNRWSALNPSVHLCRYNIRRVLRDPQSGSHDAEKRQFLGHLVVV